MREIIFRGKRADNDEWIKWTALAALFANPLNIEVDLNTVGASTGITDVNGKMIFEGDIVKTHYANSNNKSDFVEEVVYRGCRFCAKAELSGGGAMFMPLFDGTPHVSADKSVYMDRVEVIGNIHDNPELLNERDGK